MPPQRAGASPKATVEHHGKPQHAVAKALSRWKHFQSGLQLGAGYHLGQPISAGANGDVFGALCELSEGSFCEVAIKHIRITSPGVQRHAQQEVCAVFFARAKHAEEAGEERSCGHPGIVSYLDWFAGSGGPEREVFLVMERCKFALSDMVFVAAGMRAQYERGAALHAGLDPALYRFTEEEVKKVLSELLEALSFLNRHGVMHRDVKSDNVLWQTGQYKLADFGTAGMIPEGAAWKVEKNCGTLWIMAPEILGGRPHGVSCDVWSLGVVLFEMATLERPFNSKELLAYRNSPEAAAEGSFWPALCGGWKASQPSSPSQSSAALGSSSPSGARKGVQLFRSPKAESRSRSCGVSGSSLPPRATSAPLLLPAMMTGGGRPRHGGLSPSGGGSRHGGLSPSSGCGGGCVLVGGAELELEAAGAKADHRQRRKLAFLRKRCFGRWFYSGELRSLLFNEMLEESPQQRPCPAELLQQSRQGALGCGVSSPAPSGLAEACARSPQETPLLLDTSRPPLEGPSHAPAAEEEGTSPDATQSSTLQRTLRQMTGDNFCVAMEAEKVTACSASPVTRLALPER